MGHHLRQCNQSSSAYCEYFIFWNLLNVEKILGQPSTSENMFDNLATLAMPKKELCDELEKYLGMETEPVLNVLSWWFEHKNVYPCLSRMALNYLSIPGEFLLLLNLFLFSLNSTMSLHDFNLATSVDIERVFSQGRLLLLHVRSWLSVQLTHTEMCLGIWSKMGYVKNGDIMVTAVMPEVDGEEDILGNDWDAI